MWPVNNHLQRSPQFGAAASWISLQNEVAQNPVLSRVVVELIGYTPWNIALARNKYEKVEKVLDTLSWLVLGLSIPIALEKVFNGWYTQKFLKKRFSFNHSKPLSLNLEELGAHITQDTKGVKELAKNGRVKKALLVSLITPQKTI